jgi:hypothetical protein
MIALLNSGQPHTGSDFFPMTLIPDHATETLPFVDSATQGDHYNPREPPILAGRGRFFNIVAIRGDGIVKECPAFATDR